MLLGYFTANKSFVSEIPVMYIISNTCSNAGNDYEVNRNPILNGTASALYFSN